MTNTEFKTALVNAFNTHMFMDKRAKHTINELIYVLRHDAEFGGKDYNISIRRKNGEWWCIPILDSFVTIGCLSIWFEDEFVEFETEECFGEIYNCITVNESEEG